MLDFSILSYPKLIYKSYFYYISNYKFISAIKFTLFWPILLTVSLVNIIFLGLDNILFDFNKIKIKKPIFIIGFPRSGTTFLHKVLSSDTQFTTPKLWELLFAPSITQKYIIKFIFIFFKPIKALSFLLKPLSIYKSKIHNIHEIKLNNPEEDYLAFIPYAACFILILFFPIKEIWKLIDFDQSYSTKSKNKLMSIYKGLIRRHLYFHGREKIYLTKNPSFTSMKETLQTHFSDSCIVGCHRAPHKAIASLLSSMDSGYSIMSRSIHEDKDIKEYINMYKCYLEILCADDLEHNKIKLLSMADLRDNLKKTIEETYSQFKLTESSEFKSVLSDMERQAKEYVSKHSYRLGDYNLSEDQIKNEFADYYKVYMK